MKSVTIIITNYNKVDYIKKSIDSALDQTYSDFNVLIIDDGSRDGSLDIIKSYVQTLKYL
jgi:glycosyltransferase involved in cell wall biosynthesis